MLCNCIALHGKKKRQKAHKNEDRDMTVFQFKQQSKDKLIVEIYTHKYNT